ncbi:MAG: D-erythronate 2-dehydrogenase [Gaiellaceae bacterium]|nr:D-erythronate 2-dehydrogenase [Gaiellaceae bacterium]
MQAVVTGGLGFLGRELVRRLEGDVAVVDAAQGDDIRDEKLLFELIEPGGVVFHLAAARGAESERDLDTALSVNLDGSRSVLEACRARGGVRLVFASTLAVFGGPAMPEEVDERTRPNPQTTYGMTKAAVELLVADYRRKGLVDGRIARLPTIIVRPDAPAQSASGFASALFRESLAGRDYELPVGPSLRLYVIGVHTAVECLLRLAALPSSAFDDDCVVNLPGLAVAAGDLVEAARRAGATGHIGVRPDPQTEAMVGSWPRSARTERAEALGLPRDESLDAIVGAYLRSVSETGIGAEG